MPGYLPTLYMETNYLSGHARSCANGAGGDCTCGVIPHEAYETEEDYAELVTVLTQAEETELIYFNKMVIDVNKLLKPHKDEPDDGIPF